MKKTYIFIRNFSKVGLENNNDEMKKLTILVISCSVLQALQISCLSSLKQNVIIFLHIEKNDESTY